MTIPSVSSEIALLGAVHIRSRYSIGAFYSISFNKYSRGLRRSTHTFGINYARQLTYSSVVGLKLTVPLPILMDPPEPSLICPADLRSQAAPAYPLLHTHAP